MKTFLSSRTRLSRIISELQMHLLDCKRENNSLKSHIKSNYELLFSQSDNIKIIKDELVRSKNEDEEINNLKTQIATQQAFIDNLQSQALQSQGFMLKTSTGQTPPKYIHNDANLALVEAERLANLYKCDVTILEIVGKINYKTKQVPVTETIHCFENNLSQRFSQFVNPIDDLPF